MARHRLRFWSVLLCCFGISIGLAVSQVSAPQQVRVSEAVAQALLLKRVDPTYPPEARSAKIQGAVVLKLNIDKEGNVYKVELVSGHPLLAPAAIDAVKQWKYKPYLLQGDPVQVETTVTVNFTLANEPPATGVVGDAPGEPPKEGVIGGIISTTPTSQPQVAKPTRIRVSQGVSQGLLVTKVNPFYPPDALNARIEGTVVLKVNIDKEGNVYKVELVSGHPLLAPPAIEAVKHWKYKPFKLNGDPVEVETEVLVNFTIAGV